MKVHKGKYGQIHLIASLTAGLSRYHDEFAVSVVDEVGFFSMEMLLLNNWSISPHKQFNFCTIK